MGEFLGGYATGTEKIAFFLGALQGYVPVEIPQKNCSVPGFIDN